MEAAVSEKAQFVECMVCLGLSNDTVKCGPPPAPRLLHKYIIKDLTCVADASH